MYIINDFSNDIEPYLWYCVSMNGNVNRNAKNGKKSAAYLITVM